MSRKSTVLRQYLAFLNLKTKSSSNLEEAQNFEANRQFFAKLVQNAKKLLVAKTF